MKTFPGPYKESHSKGIELLLMTKLHTKSQEESEDRVVSCTGLAGVAPSWFEHSFRLTQRVHVPNN